VVLIPKIERFSGRPAVLQGSENRAGGAGGSGGAGSWARSPAVCRCEAAAVTASPDSRSKASENKPGQLLNGASGRWHLDQEGISCVESVGLWKELHLSLSLVEFRLRLGLV